MVHLLLHYKKNAILTQTGIFAILVIACLYGVATEFIQKYFIPNRDFDIYDIAADLQVQLLVSICSEIKCFGIYKSADTRYKDLK